MKKGEIWILNLPFIDGKEQRGVRPCMIISNTGTGLVIAIPLTTNINALRFPYTHQLKKTQENRLEKDSIALIFQVQALDKNRFIKKIGDVEKESSNEIDKMLRKMLQL